MARVQAGEIGDVTHVLAYWNRNNSWRRPVPDPSLERLINWRLYNKWSLGLIAELGSHHMDIANWAMDSNPIAAQASGSICCYHDGRETDDNVQVILSYPGGRRMVFTSMTNNAKMGDQLWLYGSKGSLNLTLRMQLLLRAGKGRGGQGGKNRRRPRASRHRRLLQPRQRNAIPRPRKTRSDQRRGGPYDSSHTRIRALRPNRRAAHRRRARRPGFRTWP